MICPNQNQTIVSSTITQKYLFLGLNVLFFSTISYSQNVGIGTANPTEKLHVVGNTRLTAVTSGDLLVRLYDSANAGTMNLYNSNIPSIQLQAYGPSVFNEQGLIDNDFRIETAGQANMFFVDAGTNRVGIGTATPAEQVHIVGNTLLTAVTSTDLLVRLYDSANAGAMDLYDNNIPSIQLQAYGPSVFNEQGHSNNNFRIESSGQANMFFVDAGTNRIGIRTNTPTSMFQMTNGGVAVGANPMAAYNNTGANGTSIVGYNQGTTNPHNAIEGVTSYSGSAASPAGIYGIAINTSLSHTAVGVEGFANGRDGTGVLGARQNTGGTGWGGVFYNDLGYTGLFGVVSDEKTKKNIQPIKKALAIVHQLNPVTYHFDVDKYPKMGLNTELEYGFIAQEVQAILPQIVRQKQLITNACKKGELYQDREKESELFTVMDYTRIIPILTQAIKEQQSIIDHQNQRIQQLEKVSHQILNYQTK